MVELGKVTPSGQSATRWIEVVNHPAQGTILGSKEFRVEAFLGKEGVEMIDTHRLH